MVTKNEKYPASLDIDYPQSSNRVTALFRLVLAIPILMLLSLLTSAWDAPHSHEAGKQVTSGGGSIAGGLFVATVLMLLFRQRYPRWWFNFVLELNRFSTRVGAYLFLLTDKYPSTEDAQSVHVELKYPDAKKDLNRWLPLVKWFLAIPHYVVLFLLAVAAALATIFAWFAILFTGKYPESLFRFVVGVGRWGLRVNAYAFLLVTDTYPPFSFD